MNGKIIKSYYIFAALIVTLCFSILVANDFGSSGATDNPNNQYEQFIAQNNSQDLYTFYDGNLRIFIVEPTSTRGWNYSNGEVAAMGEPTTNAFLDLALNISISVDFEDTLIDTVIWSNPLFADITDDNIMAIGAIYIDSGFEQNATPGYGWTGFTAHSADACAGADPYNSWPNQVTEGFSHTVILEEAMATW